MTYEEFCRQLDEIKVDNRRRFGDFGIDYDIEWDGYVAADAHMTWPGLDSCSLQDAHAFAQALESACFEGARLVGVEVEG